MCPAASRQPGTTFCLVRELFRPGAWQLDPVGGAPPCAVWPDRRHRQPLHAQLGPTGSTTTSQTQTSPPGRSVPGIVDSVVGRRPNTGVRLGRLINQKSHVIRVPELCAAPRKRCNSNDAISMFEIYLGELRATFLRNHNMRRHKGTTKCPKQKTAQAEDNPSSEDAHIPGHHNCQKHRGTAPVTWRCTRYVAVHPIWGSTPDMGRCTRSEKVHCLRIGCSAPTYKNKRGTGTLNHSPPQPARARRAGNDDPVSVDSGPSPRPRTPRCPGACPQRRYARPRCLRPAPCR